jgi:hypothetical protein
LLDEDLADPAGDVLGDTAAGAVSLIEGQIVQFEASRQFSLEA